MSWPAYDAYRDSGVAWLGRIPASWSVAQLRHVCDVSTGDKDTANRVDDGEYPFFIRSEEIHRIDSWSLDCEAVLTPGDGAVGKIFHHYIGKFDFHQRVYAFYNFKGVTGRYFFYYFSGLFAAVALDGSAKTTVDSLRMPLIKGFHLTFPGVQEQRKVVRFLDRETSKIDALIGKQKHLIASLRDDLRTIITHAVTHGLDADVVTKDSRVESLGRIPQHWIATPLKHALRSEPGAIKAGPFGSDLTASEMEGDFAKVYNQRAVLDRDPLAGPEWVSEAKYREMGAFKVLPGDILVTTRGSIGRAFEVPDDAPIGVIHPCVIRVRADQARLLNEFLLILLNETPPLREQFSLLSNATTIDVIYSGTLASCTVPIPPLAEQKQIVEYIREGRDKIDSLIAKAIEVVDTLREFRSTLITDAVTGKIDVQGVI